MEEKVLIEAKNLKKYFKVGANSQLHAADEQSIICHLPSPPEI